MSRADWDEYFLSIAETVATRSTCDRAHVGCVLVRDKRIVATGYNGSIRGHAHCDEVGHLLDEAGRCIRTIHAEQNAILFARESLEGATAYVTHEPCDVCCKLLNQAGVARVVFRWPDKSERSEPFRAGMKWEQFGAQ